MEQRNNILQGNSTKRVPVQLLSVGFCAKTTGFPLAKIYEDVEKSFWAQKWTQEMYGCEGSPTFVNMLSATWDFGGEIKFPTSEWGQAPLPVRYPVQSKADVDRLALPDLRKSRFIKLAMEFSKLCERHNMPITICITSPFTSAGNVCGLEKLCRWMIKKPDVAHRLLQVVTDHCVQTIQYWVDAFGAKRIAPIVGAPSDSNQVISPKQFEAFGFPYLKELHEKVLAMGVRRLFCHICGDQNLNLPFFAKIPMGEGGIVTFGHEVDLTTAIEYFGDHCIIGGNVEPQLIQNGTPRQIYEIAKKCIEKGKHAPKGYILMPGCELPPMAPPYNVYMLKKAAEDFGR
ncbi:uroporphyrinogen decarboxylase family protein [Thermodesulfobacteriota bacterium]